MRCIIPNKVKFVNELNNIIPKYHGGVNKIEYKVYKFKPEGWLKEFLVITYEGGAKTVRCCDGNSFSAIFEELSQYLDSGYYMELNRYNALTVDPNWIEMTLEQLEEDYRNK